MSYDSDTMAKIAEMLYQVHVEKRYGAAGIDRLKVVLRAVKRVFQIRSPQSFVGGLVVFAELPGVSDVVDASGTKLLPDNQALSDLPSGAMLEVMDDGSLRAWPVDLEIISSLASRAVVYVYSESLLDGPEAIAFADSNVSIPNPNGYPSALAPPTFWELESALDWYDTRLARRSTCKILKKVWATDTQERRLVLRNHPEVVMRESLAQHLRSSLRDHKSVRVNEEQNMSETEPVDIEVSWSLTTHIAILEVKWLGRCLDPLGSRLASYSHTDGRARDGITQLAGYLDDAYERNPGHEVQGYLIVFDARRRGVTSWEPGGLTSQNAWYYVDKEIDYRDSIPDRKDMRGPRRFYLEPRVDPPVVARRPA